MPDQHDPIAADLPRDEVEHLERRAVGPLKILQHDQHRPLDREARQELRQVPEQPCLQLRRIASRRRRRLSAILERGKELHQLRGSAAGEQREHRRLHGAQQRKQRVGEYGVRNARLDGIGAANGDGEPALRRLFGERVHQVGLADPAFADDEERSPCAGVGVAQRRGERGKVRRASDERRRGRGWLRFSGSDGGTEGAARH